jgi:hypothetical protein
MSPARKIDSLISGLCLLYNRERKDHTFYTETGMNEYMTDLAYCMNRLYSRIHQAAAWIPMLLILLAFFTLPGEMLPDSAQQSTASISTSALDPTALHGFQGHDRERHVEFGHFPESAPVLTHQRPSSLKDRFNRDDLSPRTSVP